MRRVELLRRFSRKKSFPILRRLRPADQDWNFALSPRCRQIPFRQPAAAYSWLRMTYRQVISSRSRKSFRKRCCQVAPAQWFCPRSRCRWIHCKWIRHIPCCARTLRNFCCENPGVLDTTSALVQLPPVGDAQSPYQVPPPLPVWPVPSCH